MTGKSWLNIIDPITAFLRKSSRLTPPQAGKRSQWRRAWQRLKKHKLAWWGGVVLLVLYFMAVFADIIAPYPYDKIYKKNSWHPPTAIHFYDENGFSFQPFIYEHERYYDEANIRHYREIKDNRIYLTLFPEAPTREFWGLVPINFSVFGVEKGSATPFYLMGADADGRDIFSRTAYGGRVSLSVGILGVIISFSIGLVVGGISGYFGGRIDSVLMRLSEMIMMTPGFYLMLALRASFPDTVSSAMVYLLIVVIMSFIGWAGLARVIRGMVLSLKNETYVDSARALGASHLDIIVRHILPGTFSYAIVAATLSIPSYILGESALSLLTLGIQEPEASWGNMLAVARDISNLQLYPWILWPGFFIFLTVMAYNFLGDGLRDALDPKTALQE